MNKTLSTILAPVLVAGGLAGCARDVPQHTTCTDPLAHTAQAEYIPPPQATCDLDSLYSTMHTPDCEREAYDQVRRILACRALGSIGRENSFAQAMLYYVPYAEDSERLRYVLNRVFTGLLDENSHIGYLSESVASDVELAVAQTSPTHR